MVFKRCRIGSTKAAVFPVPVCASPRTSRPSSAAGMVWSWIGRGVSKPRAATPRRIDGANANLENPDSDGDEPDSDRGEAEAIIK